MMKNEFIENGQDCPAILFARGDPETVARLMEALRHVGTTPVPLHEVPGVAPTATVRVHALLGKKDLGARSVPDGGFEWVKDLEGWGSVIDLLAPFTQETPGERRFQYLSRDGPVTVIVSTHDHW